jgi:quinohemoprotein ethanol dehydrogenase
MKAIRIVLVLGVVAGAACNRERPIDDARLRDAAADSSDWLMYGRTYNEQRFSPLTQISDQYVLSRSAESARR